jgi:hypothetical protein
LGGGDKISSDTTFTIGMVNKEGSDTKVTIPFLFLFLFHFLFREEVSNNTVAAIGRDVNKLFPQSANIRESNEIVVTVPI